MEALQRFPLGTGEKAPEPPGAGVGHTVTPSPEARCDVLQRGAAPYLAQPSVLDLPSVLHAEVEVQALVIEAPARRRVEPETVVHTGYELLQRDLSWLQA